MNKYFSFNKPMAVNTKIIRASSFSELSSSKKCVIQEQYFSQHDNVVKQNSSEETFDKQTSKSNLSIVSQEVKLDNGSRTNESSNLPNVHDDLTFPIEHLSLVKKGQKNYNSILAPPKFIVDRSKKSSVNNHDLSADNFSSKPAFKFSRLNSIQSATSFDDSIFKNENDIFKTKKDETFSTNNTTSHDFNEICNSKSNKDQKYNTSELKKRLKALMEVDFKPKKPKRMYLFYVTCFIVLLLATVFCFGTILKVNLLDKFCDPQFKFQKVPEELKKFIYGQDDAINNLIKFFKRKNNQIGFDILIFIGGTGVGKSYTSEIIRNNLKETNNIIDIFPPLFNKEVQAYSSLSICKCNVIRLDNLKYDDIIDVVRFSSILKERAKKYCIIILAIFNPEEIDHNLNKVADLNRFSSVIESKFKVANFKPNVISYIPLSDEALTKCITDLADYTQIELSDDVLNNIKHDLLKSNSGCKGAYAKVQVTKSVVKKSEL